MNNKIEDIDRLKNAVEAIDSLSQEGFTEIAAIASLALLAMESPAIHNIPNHTLAHAFQVIRSRANDIRDLISCEAEQVGCNSTREIFGKLIEAHSAAIRKVEA